MAINLAPSYPTYAGGGAPSFLTGNRKKDQRAVLGGLSGRLNAANQGADSLDQLLQGYFADPSGGASGFQDYYTKAAQAAVAPSERAFNDSIGGVSASIARRFGGNASTEESRVVRGTADDFSRNLTEALARVGPQAVQAGQNRGSQLLSGRNVYGSEGSDISQLILAHLQKQKGNSPWGKILGTAAGGVGGFFLGGPPGAIAGAKAGNSIGGSF